MFVEVPKKLILDAFLDWYYRNVSDYEWYPVTVADRINIRNLNKETIAYKLFGGIDGKPVEQFYIRESEYKLFGGLI